MIHTFSEDSIHAVSAILGVSPKKNGNAFRFELSDKNTGRKLALEIHLSLQAGDKEVNLVSVYKKDTFLQLHNCTGFVASELLRQVTFFGKQGDHISGLIVEKEGGCSLYANVHEAITKGDFTEHPPEIMMSSVALSLTETVDLDGFDFDDI